MPTAMAPLTTPHIPLPYLLFHLYIEPLLLLPGGLYLTLFSPRNFILSTIPSPISAPYRLNPPQTTSTAILSSITTNPPPAEISPVIQLLIFNTFGLYLVLMSSEAVVLRLARHDLRIWRAVLGAMSLCDVVHLTGLWIVGGREFMSDPLGKWAVEDWVNVGILACGFVIRMGFLAGWGVKDGAVRKPAEEKGE